MLQGVLESLQDQLAYMNWQGKRTPCINVLSSLFKVSKNFIHLFFLDVVFFLYYVFVFFLFSSHLNKLSKYNKLSK